MSFSLFLLGLTKVLLGVKLRILFVLGVHNLVHLYIMHVFSSVIGGNVKLLEHEAGKWLTKETLNSVDWLPADIQLIETLKQKL